LELALRVRLSNSTMTNMKLVRTTIGFALIATLSACSTYAPFIPSSGPTADNVMESPSSSTDNPISVVDLTTNVARRVVDRTRRHPGFSAVFGDAPPAALTLGPGDAVEISVWEAPPAALFGTSVIEPRGLNASSSRVAVLPEQVIAASGMINMPFAGAIQAAGRSVSEVEAEIARRLRGKANDPQVIVRVLRNVSSTVTVVGEVQNSTRLPLSARGERLLDALAASGGVRQPLGKVTVQVTRQNLDESNRRVARSAALPLESIIADPTQNIILQPGDIVSVVHLPNSFTVLGAATKNEEINFEAQGITLAQALARSGGLRDERANARGVFIFRFEDPAVLDDLKPTRTTLDGRVPVVYRVDLKDPGTFFVAQDFPVRNKDVIFVSNAPAADLQKFLNLVASVTLPFVTIHSLD
jgi:polysaccharide biosynthesis/export protein